MAVIVGSRVDGSLDDERGREISLSCPVDANLADAILSELAHEGVSTTAVSYGSNRPYEATMPMDWGALIPLWYMGGRAEPPLPVVLVSPSRQLPGEAHVAAGRVFAHVAEKSGKRVAVIASADHGHAHDPQGPYGYNPASAVYDDQVVELVRGNRLVGLLEIDPSFVGAAQADSWWQMLVLHGAIDGRFDAELLSYEAPTYFGMLCASFTPRPS